MISILTSSSFIRRCVIDSSQARGYRRAVVMIWSLIITAFITSLNLFSIKSIDFDWESAINLNLIIAISCAPVMLFYCFIRFDARVIAWTNAVMFLAIFPMAFIPFTYATTALGGHFALWDNWFDAADKALGYDWRLMLSFANQHPDLASIARTPYLSHVFQAVAILVLLILRAEYELMHQFKLAAILAIAACSIIAVFVPAIGYFSYFHVTPDMHSNFQIATTTEVAARHVLALRDGSFDVFSYGSTTGIIFFPSFHAVLGILYIWSGWRVPIFRWAFLALNGALIAATPLHGSHYLVDVIGGVGIAIASIKVAGWLCQPIVWAPRLWAAKIAGRPAASGLSSNPAA